MCPPLVSRLRSISPTEPKTEDVLARIGTHIVERLPLAGIWTVFPRWSRKTYVRRTGRGEPLEGGLSETMMTDAHVEAMIDETLAQTFPASDAPSWTLGRYSQPQQPAVVHPSTAAHGTEPAPGKSEQTEQDDLSRERR